MNRHRVLTAFAAAGVFALAIACSDDGAPSEEQTPAGSPTFPPIATLSPTPAPTPLERIDCDVDVPDVVLQAGGETQAGLPVQMEWPGPDCTYGGAGHDFYYLPAGVLEIEQGDEPELTISVEPDELQVLAWQPDLQNATKIASGETAVPMDATNQGLRSAALQLDVSPTPEQSLPAEELEPGDYGIEVFARFPDGVVVYTIQVRVS